MENEKPKHLTEFLNDNEALKEFDEKLATIDKTVLLNFATKCVLTNYLYFNHLFKNCCNICDKEMTDEDKKLVESKDRIIVCKEHREYSNVTQVDLEREKLGFKKRIIV
jgi:hypothetical protein